jgi:hypothetical protein
MNNDMNCSMMMFGRAVRYGISYKNGQSGFRIYQRKYYQNFKVAIDAGNYEGSHGVNLGSRQEYVIAHKTEICIFDVHTFVRKTSWHIEAEHPE